MTPPCQKNAGEDVIKSRSSAFGKRKRTPIQREEDLLLIGKLLLQGRAITSSDIALAFKKAGRPYSLCRQQISRDVQEVYKRWKKSQSNDLDKTFAREIARIDKIEAEAWELLDASKRDRIETTSKITEKHGKTQTIKKTQGLADSIYFQTIRWCVEQRCKLYGLYKTDKGGGDDGEPQRKVIVEVVMKTQKSLEELNDFPTLEADTSIVELSEFPAPV